jgi:uncharacterized protein YjbI with pentapeptide repeats
MEIYSMKTMNRITDHNMRLLAPIKHLKLNDCFLDEGLKYLTRIPNLERLELNRCNVRCLHYLKNLRLTHLTLDNCKVKDLPSTLTFLKLTNCTGDLSLKDLPICHLELIDCKLRDLKLVGLPLYHLKLKGSQLSSLTGLPLRHLDLEGCQIDLSSLRGLPLNHLSLEGCKITDLSSLEGLPLNHLNLKRALNHNLQGQIDLGSLRGLPLNHLNLEGCKITDLSSLEGLPLNHLNLKGCQITDLSSLRGLPLNHLNLEGCKITDVGLQSLAKLPLQELYIGFCNITDNGLSHLSELKVLSITDCNLTGECFQHFKLEELYVSLCHIGKWSFLTSLKSLSIDETSVDLSFLKNLKLESLNLVNVNCNDTDLAHLKGMPLKKLVTDDITRTGLKHLSQLPLEYLELNSESLEDVDLQYLPTTILELDIRCKNITDTGLKYISKRPHLRLLHLNSPKITALGLSYLSIEFDVGQITLPSIIPDKIKYTGPKEKCNLTTDIALVRGITDFVKFRILDTCMSHTYDFSVRELVHVWEEEKKILSVIDMAAKSKKFKNPVDTATFFYYHVIFYLHFGKFGWVDHTSLKLLETTCPYTDNASNFITMLARTNVCLCQCYSEYVLAAAGEFGYFNITAISKPGHIFPVVADKYVYFALEQGFKYNTYGMKLYLTDIKMGTFIKRFNAPNFTETITGIVNIPENCIMMPYRWTIFTSLFYALLNRITISDSQFIFKDKERGRVTRSIISYIFPDEYNAVSVPVALKDLGANGSDKVFQTMIRMIKKFMISFSKLRATQNV